LSSQTWLQVDHELAGDLHLGNGTGGKPSRLSHHSDGGPKKPHKGVSEKHKEAMGAESSDLQVWQSFFSLRDPPPPGESPGLQMFQ